MSMEENERKTAKNALDAIFSMVFSDPYIILYSWAKHSLPGEDFDPELADLFRRKGIEMGLGEADFEHAADALKQTDEILQPTEKKNDNVAQS